MEMDTWTIMDPGCVFVLLQTGHDVHFWDFADDLLRLIRWKVEASFQHKIQTYPYIHL